jgi:hypothetical protein
MQIVKPDAITSTGSVTRTGTATYYDSSGYLQTSTAGSLRFGYNPSTLDFSGLVVEDSSTNLILHSKDFTQAVWTKAGVTSSAVNTVTAPTNTLAAQKITPSATTSEHSVSQQVIATAAIGQVYTFSVFAKADGYSWIRLQLEGATGTAWVFINLSTGVIGTSSNVTVQPQVQKLPNGWVRASVSKVAGVASSITAKCFVQSEDNQTQGWLADGSSGIDLYGAQAEAKSMMTSFILTSATQQSRTAEVITGSGLLYTNVTNPYSEWSSTTTYSLGDTVVVGTYTGSNTVNITNSGTFKSLTNSNLNNSPLTSPTNWVKIAPTNQFALFDDKISSVTSRASDITMVVSCNSVDSIALLNVVADNVSCTLSDAGFTQKYLGNVVFSGTRYMLGNPSFDWYGYFFYDEDTAKTQALFLDISKVNSGIITIRISSTTTASAGNLAKGKAKYIGGTQYGASSGIIDYSKKETNEFGDTVLTVRNYSKRLSAKVFLTNANVNKVQQLLYSIRATPVLWLASDDIQLEEPLVVFGYYKDFDTEIAYPAHSLCNLEIEGLT